MSSAIAPETVIRRAESVVHAELREEAVLLDTSSGVAYRLNPTAAWLWERLREPAEVERLARELGERFGLETGRAVADAGSFATEMLRLDLIEADDTSLHR